MTDQDKLEFLRLGSRVLQLQEEITDIKEQLFLQSAKCQIPNFKGINNLGEAFRWPMTCIKCNKDIDKCVCPDLQERLKILNISIKKEVIKRLISHALVLIEGKG
jgi:hypothetical protein